MLTISQIKTTIVDKLFNIIKYKTVEIIDEQYDEIIPLQSPIGFMSRATIILNPNRERLLDLLHITRSIKIDL